MLFGQMVGVLFLKAGAWETSNLHSYYSDELTFYYAFEFESDDSMYIWIGGVPPFDPGELDKNSACVLACGDACRKRRLSPERGTGLERCPQKILFLFCKVWDSTARRPSLL